MRLGKGRAARGESVPAAPFQRWLSDRFERYSLDTGPGGATKRLCVELGWQGEYGMRRLYRYRHSLKDGRYNISGRRETRHHDIPTSTFPRPVVEDALHRAGVDFYGMYPEFAWERDIELEPPAWCPSCREMVTPINGDCPWCDWHVGEEAA